MPAYEVEHICPLTLTQQDSLALAITKIHSPHFNAPRLFVNVRFTNISHQATYVAGKRRKANRIFAYVRHGPSRTQDDYDAVSAALMEAWDAIVPVSQVERGVSSPETELRLVMFYGAIVAGSEAGFSIPKAGEDEAWIKENIEKFQKKADEVDEDFADMIREVKDRGMI
ncbi:hypothetical protein BDV97DRAFT_298721 [Delphinella strobiligena]|nr:hypothetical protein BDV97DRAFT_298721 [Delphinella strobiligena]